MLEIYTLRAKDREGKDCFNDGLFRITYSPVSLFRLSHTGLLL